MCPHIRNFHGLQHKRKMPDKPAAGQRRSGLSVRVREKKTRVLLEKLVPNKKMNDGTEFSFDDSGKGSCMGRSEVLSRVTRLPRIVFAFPLPVDGLRSRDFAQDT
jgi:hypothetical protein